METLVKGSWEEKKDKLRQIYSNLTEDDFFYIDGKESIMLERLQYKLGKSKEELRDLLVRL